ncbi:CppA N-terminal domain-containing protein [Streptococcus sp. DD13]|uniref:CppA N-terminal domain-containing protein n=1 Tax=Streptococcus sp. DD13 TaxID=1777881 RepID=UPI00079617FB|nr:CppA N-terminal domain-containing protein [Streptococcus sp. DD13]KXT77978.1 C3-degrading proteinase [Streptococcus sp. DD13]
MSIIKKIVPTIKINNRRRNIEFATNNLGLKVLSEENAFVFLGGHRDPQKVLELEEAPSYRNRAVKGPKKLARLILRVGDAREIENLLATGVAYEQLYQGDSGYAFEVLSPEGDRFLLHAEEDRNCLSPLEHAPAFQVSHDFKGLSQVSLEGIELRVPDPEATQAFYRDLFLDLPLLFFQKGEGEDLQTKAEEVWDLSGLTFEVEKGELLSLRDRVQGPYFMDKKEQFLQTVDPNQLELWVCR